jgi:hypothetical protein
MHPSFGIEITCPPMEWKEMMNGPSLDAVLAHTYKVLHYRSLFIDGVFPTVREQSSPNGRVEKSENKLVGDPAEAA